MSPQPESADDQAQHLQISMLPPPARPTYTPSSTASTSTILRCGLLTHLTHYVLHRSNPPSKRLFSADHKYHCILDEVARERNNNYYHFNTSGINNSRRIFERSVSIYTTTFQGTLLRYDVNGEKIGAEDTSTPVSTSEWRFSFQIPPVRIGGYEEFLDSDSDSDSDSDDRDEEEKGIPETANPSCVETDTTFSANPTSKSIPSCTNKNPSKASTATTAEISRRKACTWQYSIIAQISEYGKDKVQIRAMLRCSPGTRAAPSWNEILVALKRECDMFDRFGELRGRRMGVKRKWKEDEDGIGHSEGERWRMSWRKQVREYIQTAE